MLAQLFITNQYELVHFFTYFYTAYIEELLIFLLYVNLNLFI